MADKVWPADGSEPPLFILDAAHAPELECLTQWLTAQWDQGGALPDYHHVVIRIASDPERIDATPLMAHLGLPPATPVTPLRVIWRDGSERRTSPRIRDLLRGNRRRPNARKALRLLAQDRDNAQCIAGRSATLGELQAQFAAQDRADESRERLAAFIANRAGLALDIAERQRRGGRYKVPRRVAQNLRASAGYLDALRAVSEETGQTVAALDEQADEIFAELISIPRSFWQDVIAAFNRKVISMGYQPELVVDQAQVTALRDLVRQKPSVLLWTHKSHIDGFAVYSTLFENDFPVPHLLGGVNMAFAGLGYAARRSGAIFIRRSFQDDPLYKAIFRQYIGYLLEKRFPLTWAFEGTRSRVGKLMPPRYGILKYVVEAAEATDANDLQIIPVALNYDLIQDVRDYVKEQSGGVKQPESLRWFLGYLRGLRRPLGKIYIDFGEPVTLPSQPVADDALGLKKIALQVGVEANRVTPITLSSLVCTILLGVAPRALTRLELGKDMLRYLKWARARGIRVASEFLRGNDNDLNQLADVLGEHGLVSRFDEGPDVVYALSPEQHATASYYRNSTVHHFIVKAIAEMSLLKVADAGAAGSEAFWAEAERIRELFKFEFFYAPRDDFRHELDVELRRYEDSWSTKLDADPAFANRFLREFRPLFARAALLPFIEAYRIVANIIARLEPGATLSQKDCVSQSLAYARQAYLQRRISSEASIGKLYFENAYRFAQSQGLVEDDGASLANERRQFSEELTSLANRLDRIGALTLPGNRW
ncbi:MAG: 1-acyl-sn-glycerol-3-phosphate acyltransferase [Pseudomonadota bacterium]